MCCERQTGISIRAKPRRRCCCCHYYCCCYQCHFGPRRCDLHVMSNIPGGTMKGGTRMAAYCRKVTLVLTSNGCAPPAAADRARPVCIHSHSHHSLSCATRTYANIRKTHLHVYWYSTRGAPAAFMREGGLRSRCVTLRKERGREREEREETKQETSKCGYVSILLRHGKVGYV
jgi:hypothetical protein